MNENEESKLLSQLEQLKRELKRDFPAEADRAEYWINTLRDKQKFLDDHAHSIVFIGSVGVGKSSLIAVAANLLIDENLTDRASLKKNAVLSTGAGRTTVCEVQVRTRQENETGIGLIIEPFSKKDIQQEIAIYAETEWSRRQSEAVKGKNEREPTPEEIQRVIRNMTDYNITKQQKGEKRSTLDPLDELIPKFDSHEKLKEHLLERVNLEKRTKTEWWWNTDQVGNLQALKTCFENINYGKEPTAMPPDRMTVVVPKPLHGSDAGLEITLIDTRGLDNSLESRPDLNEYLRDQRSIIVLCTAFKDAPNSTLRTLLHTMADNGELREAIPRTVLVLIDQDDAQQVNDAEGDREFGQALKIEECYRVLEDAILEDAGFSGKINKKNIIAFDALQDDRNRLQLAIDNSLAQLRQKEENEKRKLLKEANSFIENAAHELRPGLCDKVDEQLKETMAQHLLTSAPPLRTPLEGLLVAILETRYASVVYASCRRNGDYSNLNLYAAIRAKASREATQWLDKLINPVLSKLDELKQEESFALVHDYITLQARQYQDARLKVIGDYADRLEKQVKNKLSHDEAIWNKCANEWGKGGGFKDKVLAHLKKWESRQQDITAHETTTAKEKVPLLKAVFPPPQAPQFTLHIRNLRVLKQVDWTPSQLSVIIGANGTGKTTLLLILKLLRLAYERGLPEAVSLVLGGSSHLKTWGINDDEPIEMGIDIDTVSWRIQLVPREGSVSYLTHERLTEQNREIFYRDGLGEFYYGGEQIEPDSRLGLRILMDRGVYEPALRQIASFLQKSAVYHDPDLMTLRQGSKTSEDRILQTRGINALALLRRWYQDHTHLHRYQFVVEGLAAAFPNTVEKLDFVEEGNTVVARIYPPNQDFPSPLANEANGVVQLLVLFCEIANAESVVAIDEPENSLHPYALRAFLRRTNRWAQQHNLTVLLATHSTVLLDELSATPEKVFVMKAPNAAIPIRLDELCNPEWLESFKLGDLYEQGEIGSNEDEE
jgi:predicted ATPase